MGARTEQIRVFNPLTETYSSMEVLANDLCSDCPPQGYSTDKTRCTECPRRLITAGQREVKS